jgi:hypothetical protein
VEEPGFSAVTSKRPDARQVGRDAWDRGGFAFTDGKPCLRPTLITVSSVKPLIPITVEKAVDNNYALSFVENWRGGMA